MSYWLFKSEPDTWSWDDQVKRGKKGQEWDGVRNFQARNHVRNMKKGDLGFFYHTGDEKAVVGIVEIKAEAHPESASAEWDCVDLVAVEPLKRAVTLSEIKADPALKDMVLVKNARLSVQPVTDAEWKRVIKLAGIKA
jgi:predicted RNA-binding protein with PUA-like domain